ncbi:MAG TPA: hypothetical protein VKQ06_00875 [Gammaproteobacteria bacterium]|nr:hypothetical protein [Gammaproteobacteria bacterium]
MARVIVPVFVLALAGCATMDEWRELQIDGSSQAAFDESLTVLNEQLPERRREMLQLAFVDIVRTELQNAERPGDDSYTYDDFRVRLDGMTYEGVIALANQSGRSIATIYYQGGQGRGDPWNGRSWPQTDPSRFPPHTVIPMPSGPNASWTQ